MPVYVFLWSSDFFNYILLFNSETIYAFRFMLSFWIVWYLDIKLSMHFVSCFTLHACSNPKKNTHEWLTNAGQPREIERLTNERKFTEIKPAHKHNSPCLRPMNRNSLKTGPTICKSLDSIIRRIRYPTLWTFFQQFLRFCIRRIVFPVTHHV